MDPWRTRELSLGDPLWVIIRGSDNAWASVTLMAVCVLILSSLWMSSLLSKPAVLLEIRSPVLNVLTSFSTFFLNETRQIGQQSRDEMQD